MERPLPNRWHLLIKVIFLGIIILSLGLSMYFLVLDNMAGGVPVLLLPFIVLFLVAVFANPLVGVLALFYANYFALGLARYVPGPLGLSVDGLLVLTWLSLFFSQFNRTVDWKRALQPMTWAAVIWFGYSLFQLVNPEAVSRIAWFYAMRGVSLYMLLTIPLVFILLPEKRFLDKMLRLWAWFTLIGVLKGMMQKFIGVDPWEDYWLDTVGGKTHRLPGGLRIFSFFSDSATFGGSMGFSGVVFSIVGLTTPKLRDKVFYLAVAGAAFFGMLISGTRGAMAVPAAGFALFAIFTKRTWIIATVYGGMLFVYGFLKWTNIGSSVYELRRIRTALDPNNPSLLVRKENQRILGDYLSSRPFGGGIGSAGNWGLRFSPGTFLAETPTDSWYVQIWAEQGIIGLTLHLFILGFFLFSSGYIVLFRLKTFEYAGLGAALSCGVFGLMGASYGSGALGQMPNGLIVYASMAFIFLLPRWEKEKLERVSPK